MKAFFLINSQGDWQCAAISNGLTEGEFRQMYTELDGQGEPVPRQFYVVDLPPMEDLRT